jgi:hypothetical protein
VASQGKDAGKVVYFTAYHGLSALAERFVVILPAYVAEMVDGQTTKQWFHTDSLVALVEVEFQFDYGSNLTCTWKTPEDDLMQDLLDEDMNVQFQLEGLNHIEQNMVRLTMDDASIFTFGDSLGEPHPSTGVDTRDHVAVTAHTGHGGATA